MIRTKNHNRPNRPVIDALQDAGDGLCDACLVIAVGKTKNDAITPARRLCNQGKALSHGGTCNSCGKSRVITQLVKAHTGKAPTAPSLPASGSLHINQLDDLRRELIGYLNRLDPANAREGFAKRVGRLRNIGELSPTVAALMLTHGAYRNEMYYTPFKPCAEEVGILNQVTSYLRTYLEVASKSLPTQGTPNHAK
jgi:hypothetical protein